jgi:hypothetical protein
MASYGGVNQSKAPFASWLAELVEQERTCWSFLQFRIEVEASGGPITFEVTGPSAPMLRAL